MFIRCKTCEYKAPEYEIVGDNCASCAELERQDESSFSDTKHNILCGCGWGKLGASTDELDRLDECPCCGRAFDNQTVGWI